MVLALFVASQLLALTDAGRHLIEDAGVTPAQYARSGFFVRTLAATVPGLALGLVVVSLRRMQFYDRAFGLTMLRLWVVGAVVWLGGVLVMMALHDAGLGSRRRWVLGAAGGWALTLVLFASAADPEAFVVHHNVARARAGATFDASYLGTLSDDALRAIADEMSDASPALRPNLQLAIRCDRATKGVATLNVAIRRAARTRRELCASGSG